MSDLIGIAILIAIVVGIIQDSTRRDRAKPKSPDEEFLETAKIKPWKGEK